MYFLIRLHALRKVVDTGRNENQRRNKSNGGADDDNPIKILEPSLR